MLTLGSRLMLALRVLWHVRLGTRTKGDMAPVKEGNPEEGATTRVALPKPLINPGLQ